MKLFSYKITYLRPGLGAPLGVLALHIAGASCREEEANGSLLKKISRSEIFVPASAPQATIPCRNHFRPTLTTRHHAWRSHSTRNFTMAGDHLSNDEVQFAILKYNGVANEISQFFSKLADLF